MREGRGAAVRRRLGASIYGALTNVAFAFAAQNSFRPFVRAA